MPPPAADMENGAVGSTAAEVEAGESPGSSPVIKTKGRGLRRWRRIPREQRKEGSAGGGGGGGGSAQLHKRRIPLPGGARSGKLHEVVLEEEEESSTASVESRFVPPGKLDPSLGALVASAGFSLGAGGADSDHSEDWSSGSRSSTAASAPRRHNDLSPFAADRAGRSSRAARPRAFSAAEARNSLRSSDAGNGIHKVLADHCDHGEEAPLMARDYCKENGSVVVGRWAQGSVDSDADAAAERSVGNNGDIGSGMQSSADPYAESVSLLQRTQEALENEIKMFAAISKESSDNFDGNDDDWIGLVDIAEPLEGTSQNVKDPESRPEEASYLGRLFLEKTEAEIQSIILTRAAQTWAPLVDDQIALYNAQKSLSGDYKQLELKLQHTKNRAAMLEEMAEKLKAECRDLSGRSEVLRLQSRASRVSLFCFIQFVLLFTAVGTFLARLLPSPTEYIFNYARNSLSILIWAVDAQSNGSCSPATAFRLAQEGGQEVQIAGDLAVKPGSLWAFPKMRPSLFVVVALPPVRRVFLFPSLPPPPPPPFGDVVRALRGSLKAVPPTFYPFAGTLVYSLEEEEEEGLVSIVVEAGGGVAFVEAETDLDFGWLVDEWEEHNEDALQQLVLDIYRDELPAPVMAAQVTEFVGGGGGVAVHHAAADSHGLWQFLEMWSASAAAAAVAIGISAAASTISLDDASTDERRRPLLPIRRLPRFVFSYHCTPTPKATAAAASTRREPSPELVEEEMAKDGGEGGGRDKRG
uniref:Uncharacterized protein n=1 Tax=Oryza meridionalis TaxID=40149 RepID=A0A0E0EN09_9ORYZ